LDSILNHPKGWLCVVCWVELFSNSVKDTCDQRGLGVKRAYMAEIEQNYLEPNAHIRVRQAERLREKIGESSIYMLLIIIYITAIIWFGGYAVYAVSWFFASSTNFSRAMS